MKFLLDTLKQMMKKARNEKMYIQIKISYGKDVHEKCPCGKNIEITGRLRSKSSAMVRKKTEILKIREYFSSKPNVIITNRIRSSNYSRTNSKYTLYAHLCDLKKCVQ
jgi:hypothetical protein